MLVETDGNPRVQTSPLNDEGTALYHHPATRTPPKVNPASIYYYNVVYESCTYRRGVSCDPHGAAWSLANHLKGMED
jgi:hypothetical protein